MSLAKLKYIFLLVLQCAIFGFSFIVIKKLLNIGCPPFMIMSIRFLIGVIFLYVVGNMMKNGENVKVSNTYEKGYGIIAGVVLFIAFASQTYGASYTSPAKSGLFTGLFVVFVPIIIMILKKKRSIKSIITAIISFVGVTIVSNVTFNNFYVNFGDLLTIFCAIMFALHFVLLEKFILNSKINALRFTIIQLLTVTICSGLTSIIIERSVYKSINWPNTLLWFIFIGVVATSITYFIQTLVQSKLSASTVSVISCIESVFAITISLLLGYEIFSLSLLIGSIIIVSSMVYASVIE